MDIICLFSNNVDNVRMVVDSCRTLKSDHSLVYKEILSDKHTKGYRILVKSEVYSMWYRLFRAEKQM